jgi:hypothetical protein
MMDVILPSSGLVIGKIHIGEYYYIDPSGLRASVVPP